MPLCLGIDTSNYTTSAALYDSGTGEMLSVKLPLPVKKGEAGLRQSDAVFHHTRQLPLAIEELAGKYPTALRPSCIGVSVRPRNEEGSYMPCFLSGEAVARSTGALLGIPVYSTSHQMGHILAALFSADMLSMLKAPFIAFHVSGGTTDCLLCTPDGEELIKISKICSSLDLKAGQLIDRTGLMLGLDFPCGAALERLAAGAEKSIPARAVIKNGCCCLSGFENKAQELVKKGEARESTARFILNAVCESISEMTAFARKKHGSLPVIYAGGVMSDGYIRDILSSRFDGIYFSEPQYSCDNAAGTALYAYYCSPN